MTKVMIILIKSYYIKYIYIQMVTLSLLHHYITIGFQVGFELLETRPLNLIITIWRKFKDVSTNFLNSISTPQYFNYSMHVHVLLK